MINEINDIIAMITLPSREEMRLQQGVKMKKGY